MQIIIKTTGTSLTSAIEQDVREKVSALKKFLKPNSLVRVEIGMESKHHQNGEIFRAEIKISPSGQYAESTAEDLYSAVDLLVPKIREQLVDAKDKKLSLRKRFGRLKWKFWEKGDE